MIVEIDKSIFVPQEGGNTFKELQMLLDIINMEGRYRLKISNPSILDSPYFKDLSPTDQQIVIEGLDATINESLKTDRLVKADGAKYSKEPIYNAKEGYAFLSSPVSIWVENSLNDSFFVRAIIRCLRPDIPLDNWIYWNWLSFENAGGCSNAQHVLEEKLIEKTGKSKMLRCFILLDSDKTWPDEVITKYDQFIEFCNQYGFVCHILHKRAMENYMPEAVFDEFRSNITNSWINAYLYLSPEQKDYFNIAEGFNGNISEKILRNQGCSGRQNMKEEVQRFYSSVSDANYEYLENGLTIGNFKTLFPRKFEESPAVHVGSLTDRIKHQPGENELSAIVEEILKLT